jgi:hypothetical protein
MAAKPSKKFVNEMEKMYPKGATITPKKPVKAAPMGVTKKKKPTKKDY